MVLAAVIVCLVAESAQLFGSLEVDWGRHNRGEHAGPVVVQSQAVTKVEPLEQQCVSSLQRTLRSLGADCVACKTQRHWVSAVRHFVLTAEEPDLQGLLHQRGEWCDACMQPEHWRDRAMAVVHLPIINSVESS